VSLRALDDAGGGNPWERQVLGVGRNFFTGVIAALVLEPLCHQPGNHGLQCAKLPTAMRYEFNSYLRPYPLG
jgi:hypothetical protein